MFTLSICSILKNEQSQIARIVSQWKHPKVENVFVDTGSEDGSLEAFAKRGVTPFHYKWHDDFAAARNYSISKANAPWVLWLDADDHIDSQMLEDLVSNIPRLNPQKAYRLIIKNPTDEGEGQVFRQIRLFPNFKQIQFKGRVHEELATSVKENGLGLEDLDYCIDHRGYFSAKARKEKSERNQKILQQQVCDDPQDAFAQFELGNCYYQQGDYLKAETCYLKSLELRQLIQQRQLSKSSGSALDGLEMVIGQNALKQNQKDNAQQWFLKSTQSSPQFLGAHFELAKIYLEKKDFIEAEKSFRSLLSQPKKIHSLAESVESLRQNSAGYLVLILFASKRNEEALNFLEEAYSPERGLSVDWALPFEICYDLKNTQRVNVWLTRFSKSSKIPDSFNNQPWWDWCLKQKNDAQVVKGNRMDQEQLIRQIAQTPTKSELWKSLKSLGEKFDNWDRSLARIALLRNQEVRELEVFYNEEFYAQLNPSRNSTKTR